MIEYSATDKTILDSCTTNKQFCFTNVDKGLYLQTPRGILTLTGIPGDCTAISLFGINSFLNPLFLEDVLKTVQNFMSVSGKITGFFTFQLKLYNKESYEQLQNILAVLKRLKIKVIKQQLSSRTRFGDTTKQLVSVSCCITIPNPQCISYNYNKVLDPKHNYHKILRINKYD